MTFLNQDHKAASRRLKNAAGSDFLVNLRQSLPRHRGNALHLYLDHVRFYSNMICQANLLAGRLGHTSQAIDLGALIDEVGVICEPQIKQYSQQLLKKATKASVADTCTEHMAKIEELLKNLCHVIQLPVMDLITKKITYTYLDVKKEIERRCVVLAKLDLALYGKSSLTRANENNAQVLKILSKKPHATLPEIHRLTGISTSAIARTTVWKSLKKIRRPKEMSNQMDRINLERDDGD